MKTESTQRIKPEIGKFYSIHYTGSDGGKPYMGTGECLQDMGDGRYKFILPTTSTLGFFRDEDIICEQTPYSLVDDRTPFGRPL